jgi:hypothetical protein
MIPFRLPKSALKPLLIASLSLVVAGGIALAIVPTPRPLSTTIRPQIPSPSSTPSASNTPATAITTPASVPSVAGVSTIAPSATPQPAPQAAAPGITCPNDTGSIVHLTIKYPGVAATCDVHFSAGLDPCSLLQEAKTEGMITALNIYDSPDYMAHHNNSAYLYDLNGYKDNWTYSALDPMGKPLLAPGCPFPALQSRDSVTWKFGG